MERTYLPSTIIPKSAKSFDSNQSQCLPNWCASTRNPHQLTITSPANAVCSAWHFIIAKWNFRSFLLRSRHRRKWVQSSKYWTAIIIRSPNANVNAIVFDATNLYSSFSSANVVELRLLNSTYLNSRVRLSTSNRFHATTIEL